MSVTSRATIRLTLVSLAQSTLTTVPSANIAGELPGAFAGATPMLLILSGGTERRPSGYQEDLPRFFLSLRTYVLLSTPDGAWEADDAEARLDAIEADVAALLLAQQQTATWQNIQYAGRSVVEDVITIDGFVYRRETTPLLVECDDDD